MIKIYYDSDGVNYFAFKAFLYGEFFIESRTTKGTKGGNKRKSGRISISYSFLNSNICNSSKMLKKPDLRLWNEYLKSFQISEKILLEWLNKNENYIYEFVLKELREKIKDNL